MKLNFNIPLKDLAGKPVAETPNIGATLANIMVSQPKGDVLKFFSWAMDMYAGKPIDLDKSDQKTLQEFITGSNDLTIMGKAQLLQVFEKSDKLEKVA